MQISFLDWEDSTLARRAATAMESDEVRVVLASMPADEVALRAWDGLLSPDERARAEQFRVREPRRQFVFGRALLRQLLGSCLDIEPSALAFSYQPRGKPFLSQSGLRDDLRFNLSHSGRMVAVALARGRAVGVDIETIHHCDDWPLMAGQIFSPRELCELHSLPGPQQRVAFFHGWTRKEAFLKATGEGLTDALPAIEVTLSPGREPELLAFPVGPEPLRQWAIRGIPLPPNFVGAVVFENNASPGREQNL